MRLVRPGGAALAVVILLLASGCTPSEVDPNARIDIAGVIERQNGRPADGVRVALSREVDFGEAFTVFATLGLACVDQHTCRGARVTRTGPDGRFAYRLTGRDTQGSIGSASTMVLTSELGPRPREATGAITTYRFQVQTEKLVLPLWFWEPSIEGATGSFGARVTWTAVPGRALPPGIGGGSLEYAIEFRRGDEVVWTVDRARSGFAFDPRVLEDTTGNASVYATLEGERVSDELGRSIDIVMRSGARPYEAAGAPLTRGMGCSVTDGEGRSIPISPCGLTDGDLSEEFNPAVCAGASGCTEPTHLSTVIDLGARRSLSLVVVRGCADRCTLETSRNTRTWRAAGVAGAENVALKLAPPVSARYLRVSAPVSIAGLREISAWSGGPGASAGPLFVEPGAIPPGSPGSVASPRAAAPADEEDSGLPRLIAVGALSAVGGALAAILFGRRKRQGPAPG